MIANHFVITLIGGTILLMFLGFYIFHLIIKQNNRQNEQQIKESETRKKHLEENERMMNQISKELHDNIGQISSLVLGSLQYIDKQSTDEKVKSAVKNAFNLTEQIRRDSKNISHSLNQNFIKAGNLHLLLEQDLILLKNYHNISYELNVAGVVQQFSPETKLIVYRIAQEGFHNIIKHANASQILLLFDYQNDEFRMQIKDNGMGIPAEKMVAREGIGLSNMRERAEYLNGEIVINSNPGLGCELNLIISNPTFQRSK